MSLDRNDSTYSISMKYPALWAAMFAGAGVVSTDLVSVDVAMLHSEFVWGGLLVLSAFFLVFGKLANNSSYLKWLL